MIDFTILTGNGKVRNLAGKERGIAARKELSLDQLDVEENGVTVKVPESLDVISPSYFQGLFARSVQKLGVDGFREKYRFVDNPTILKWVDIGINRCLSSRAPLL